MSLQVVCPSCGNRLPVDESLIGKQIRCGGCQVVMEVPRPQSPPASPTRNAAPTRTVAPMATQRRPVAGTMDVVCACRARLTVPASAKGTQMRCPRCQNLIYVPSETAPTPPANSMGAGFPDLSAIGGPVSRASPLPSSPQRQHSYRRAQSTKPTSNRPIVLTAALGFVALCLLIGGTFAYQFLSNRSQATAEVTNVTASEAGPDAASEPSTEQSQPTSDPILASADPPPVEPTGATMSVSSTPQPAATAAADPRTSVEPAVRVAPPRVLPPPNEAGLQRIHFPEGYSIALPTGFRASPRAISGMTAIYQLGYADGTRLLLQITDDNSITADSAVPAAGLNQRQSPDGKIKLLPITRADDPSQLETFKIDGMNACFVGAEIDASHPDRTEEINRLYSGAIPSEAKRALADQMRAVTEFKAGLHMKAMDDRRMLEAMFVRSSSQPISPPPEWFNLLRTIRHQTPPDPSRIPPPFVKKR